MAKAKAPAKRVAWRTTFNPERDFVVIRSIFGLKRGSVFDKSLVTERRLRQLFDQRVIHYPGEQPGAITDVARRARRGGGAPLLVQLVEAAGFGAPTDHLVARGAVEIPADWATMPWNDRRALAAQLTDDPVKNGDQVTAAIEAELARRGTA